jgi:hypothetical protein
MWGIHGGLRKDPIYIVAVHRFVLSLLNNIAGVHSNDRRQIVA